ncbi:MAG: 6-phosphogluconolactonase, partial [Gemmatimonadota bacterium]
MGHRVIRVLGDAEAASHAAAAEVVARADEAVAARGVFTVALAGGTTPRRMYEILA